jgi:hypothetical protein
MSALPLEQAVQYLWWVDVAGHMGLFARLRLAGLHRIYRFFSAYLLFGVLRAALLMGAPRLYSVIGGPSAARHGPNLYGWIWVATQPLVWVFYVLVVLELYTLVLQNYKGIASLGRWVMLAGLTVGLLVSALSLSADLSNPTEAFPILRVFFVIDRGLSSSLVIFLLIITGFLAWYPVPLSRNLVVHCAVYAVYFLSLSMVVLVRNLVGANVMGIVNVAQLSIELACLMVWLFLLNRAGESKTVRVRPQPTPEDEQALVEQLEAINSTLLRAARK